MIRISMNGNYLRGKDAVQPWPSNPAKNVIWANHLSSFPLHRISLQCDNQVRMQATDIEAF
jgi:hypothetical protein